MSGMNKNHNSPPSADDAGSLDDRDLQAIEYPAGDEPGGSDNDKTRPIPGGDQDDLLAQLKAQKDETEARLLRVAADYQNYVKRAQQNIDSARQQQLFDLVKALLTPLDHFERALAVDAQSVTAQSLLDGVVMVHAELLKALEQFGITKMQVKAGQPFDPMQHEAVARQPVAGVEPDHIAAELQSGYMLDSKVLRPAKVAITG